MHSLIHFIERWGWPILIVAFFAYGIFTLWVTRDAPDFYDTVRLGEDDR